ncbi:hypothetical protein PSP6_630019 [Paraburkholderia tropica]|nr:hypothetical protein PSP6_630019 [Paraburkholderia tropica]
MGKVYFSIDNPQFNQHFQFSQPIIIQLAALFHLTSHFIDHFRVTPSYFLNKEIDSLKNWFDNELIFFLATN